MISRTSYLVAAQAVFFVIFLLSCFCFNRFSVDDFYFIGEISNKSFSEIYKHLYFNWHGRWTSNFTLLWFIQFHAVPYFLLGFNLLSFLLLVLAVKRLFRSVIGFYKIDLPRREVLIYSIIFISVFFFCTVHPNESWFWFTSSVVYFWSVIGLLMAAPALFLKKLKWHDSLLFVLGLIYVGGSNEPMTIIACLFGLVLLYKRFRVKLVISGIALLVISFLIDYLSSGTIHRDEITPGLDLMSLIVYSAYNTLKYLFFEFHLTFQIAIILCIPFYILGKRSNYNNPNFNPTREVILSILYIGLIATLNQFMVTFTLGGLGPDRAAITTSLFISVLIVRLFFLLGNYSKSSKKVVFYAPLWGCLYLLILTIYFTPIHYHYSKAFDERIQLVQEASASPIKVEPLPESGYLYSSEITTDPADFRNQHLKYGLGLEQDVVLVSD
ncbi:MAG: hypothetical protein KDD41_05580 [Flavobacteriales bacterium]|nr:hypothetical protein [Flavobacteriales bacterium]